MPSSRRSTKSAQRSSQPTLNFNGRSSKVTKPSLAPVGKADHKDLKRETSLRSISKSPEQQDHVTTPKTVKLPKRDAQHEPSPEAESAFPAIETVETAEPEAPEKAPEEVSARNVSDKEIIQYWQKKEKERKAPRVHQKDLDLHEKILREWDMSGQYGVSSFLSLTLLMRSTVSVLQVSFLTGL